MIIIKDSTNDQCSIESTGTVWNPVYQCRLPTGLSEAELKGLEAAIRAAAAKFAAMTDVDLAAATLDRELSRRWRRLVGPMMKAGKSEAYRRSLVTMRNSFAAKLATVRKLQEESRG